MQTFLPYSSFASSVSVLDTLRLGKQRVEAMQLVIIYEQQKLRHFNPGIFCKVRDIYNNQRELFKELMYVYLQDMNEIALFNFLDKFTDVVNETYLELNIPWENHSASVMWRGYSDALKLYYNTTINEWIKRGYINNMPIIKTNTPNFPYWINNEEFHASHRSNLLRKDPEHYAKFGWTEPDDLPYCWPKSKHEWE